MMTPEPEPVLLRAAREIVAQGISVSMGFDMEGRRFRMLDFARAYVTAHDALTAERAAREVKQREFDAYYAEMEPNLKAVLQDLTATRRQAERWRRERALMFAEARYCFVHHWQDDMDDARTELIEMLSGKRDGFGVLPEDVAALAAHDRAADGEKP